MRRRILCLLLAVTLLLGMLPMMAVETAAAKEMDVSKEFIALLKKLEGFYAKPYWDYSQWSIGYGSCLYRGSKNAPEALKLVEYYNTNPLSEEEATEWLIEELQSHINRVRKFIADEKLTVTQNQFDALVSFTYNCGGAWTRDVEGYFHKAVKSGNMGSALIYGMLLWGSAGGEYILINRRMSEANMYINGVYKQNSYPDNFRYVFLDGAGGTPRYVIHGFDSNEKSGVVTDFKVIPSGPDKSGKIVNYEFAGWYTAREGGKRVKVLDDTFVKGTILYAHWKLPDGTPVVIPEEDTGVSVKVKVTTNAVNIRSGPATYYADIGDVNTDDELIIDLTATSRGSLWGRFDGGWISLQYTNYSDVIKSVLPKWATVTADEVNVRKAAGTSNDVVAKKNTGDAVQVTQWTHSGNVMWGKIKEGWISLQYVEWNPDNYNGKVASVELEAAPTKKKYVQMADGLNLAGGRLRVTYEDGMVISVPMTAGKVSGFDNSKLGTNTVTVSYLGHTVTFKVKIVAAVVTFLDYDGRVISTNEYDYGEKVAIPKDPVRKTDGDGSYVFRGWGSEVAKTCNGSATYTAVYELIGDINDDEMVAEDDAIYLLWHVFFPEEYPVKAWSDLDGNGKADENDAIHLLWYVFFPEDYPLDLGK